MRNTWVNEQHNTLQKLKCKRETRTWNTDILPGLDPINQLPLHSSRTGNVYSFSLKENMTQVAERAVSYDFESVDNAY